MIQFQQAQLFLYAYFGITCFAMAIFSLFIRQRVLTRRVAVFSIELHSSVMLISDFFALAFRGGSSTFAYWAVRVSNFLVFSSLYLILASMTYYLRSFIVLRTDYLPMRLRVCGRIAALGLFFLVYSQFTGFYYYFDENNCYTRAPQFWLSYVAPVMIYVMIISVVVEYRKTFDRSIACVLLAFSMLPVISAVFQALNYGLSVFDISIGVCAVLLFIVSLCDHNIWLRNIASHEMKTGLSNSYGYLQEVGQKIGRKTIVNYDAFYLDIVHMGLLNKKYGTDVGDEIIVKYANEIKTRVGEGGILGRLGGNYFVALVEKSAVEAFLKAAEGIHIDVETPMGKETVTVRSVVGAYEITPKDLAGGMRPEFVLEKTSIAVSIAKNVLKKSCIYLTDEIQDRIEEQRRLQEIIPKCMKAAEFLPYYQPKVDLSTNKLVGAEALARWNHNGQMIPPQTFIAPLEQNEAICKLDFYMLDMVCKDIKRWIAEGFDVPVISINFSRKNLGNELFAKEINAILQQYDVPAKYIQIEITETVDEYGIDELKKAVEEIQSYGMTVAIDDFGTGSSSINVLKQIPFNVLKIDKTFIDSINGEDQLILKYIIEMAKALKARVITEGVERRDQIEILEGLGCQEIQGFYFDRPLVRGDFELRMKNPEYDRN